MLTTASVTVTEQQPHYPEIPNALWHAAFQSHGSVPDHYLDPARSTVEQDDYGRTWEFRFTPVPHPGDSIQFQGYANPTGQHQEPTHQALITASFNNLRDQAAFVADLTQSVIHQPEDEPDYRPHDATEAFRAMGTYDRLGESAMLLHACTSREKPSPIPAFVSSLVEVLDDGSTIALDLTQFPHRYRFTWHLQDQAKSDTRPAQMTFRNGSPPAVPVINWPSSDHVAAMIIEHAVSLLAPDRDIILEADPSLMAAADFLAPTLRPLVIEHINAASQPQEVIDVLQPLIFEYATLLRHQVPPEELDLICRNVMDHHVTDHHPNNP